MPDFTMCEGKDCPMKAKCRRATAKPNPDRQAYFTGSPNEGDKCEYLMIDPFKKIRSRKVVELKQEA
jgi:hypothetical protein